MIWNELFCFVFQSPCRLAQPLRPQNTQNKIWVLREITGAHLSKIPEGRAVKGVQIFLGQDMSQLPSQALKDHPEPAETEVSPGKGSSVTLSKHRDRVLMVGQLWGPCLNG